MTGTTCPQVLDDYNPAIVMCTATILDCCCHGDGEVALDPGVTAHVKWWKVEGVKGRDSGILTHTTPSRGISQEMNTFMINTVGMRHCVKPCIHK